MAKNILLTSLGEAGNELPMSYYSVPKEYGFDYCDALLEAEAGIKAMLARFPIDEIIVIGGAGTYDGHDELNAVPLGYGSRLYGEDLTSFSAYRLLQYRLAQFADEIALDQKADEELLPGEAREKLARFVQEFQEGSGELQKRKFNRLFDALSQSGSAWNALRKALPEAFPEAKEHPGRWIRGVRSCLYEALKPSAKLELLPVNEETCMRFVPEDSMTDGGLWVEQMMAMEKTIVEDQGDVNLYVSLNSADAGDNFIVMNLLDILVSMPESRVRLEKIFTLQSRKKHLTGSIRDDTDGFGVSELFHGLHSFLNYGKADQVVKLWEQSGENNPSVAGMVYAMRRVDVGLSMCNIPEVEGGILRLRKLFRDERFWRESGCYGMIFSMIAESIREDYGALLEGDGEIPFIELVKWAYRHQFYQQTLTLIESSAPENLVRSGVFYYCGDEAKKDQVTQLFARQRLELKPYEYYKMDQIDHYFIKSYDRSRTKGMGGRGEDPQRVYAALRTKSLENTDDALITGLTACGSTETLQNLLFAYYHISVVRNKISHADASAMAETRLMVSESDDNSALAWMRDSIDYFIACYEKAMAEVEGRHPEVVLITGNEVRIAAERLRRERN